MHCCCTISNWACYFRAEDSQIGSNIDRALEMTAKRQFENNEEGVAKLVQWLSAEVENKKNAERKLRSLLVRCERVSAE